MFQIFILFVFESDIKSKFMEFDSVFCFVLCDTESLSIGSGKPIECLEDAEELELEFISYLIFDNALVKNNPYIEKI